MTHPAEQTLANDGVMLTERRHTVLHAPAYLGTNCLCPCFVFCLNKQTLLKTGVYKYCSLGIRKVPGVCEHEH